MLIRFFFLFSICKRRRKNESHNTRDSRTYSQKNKNDVDVGVGHVIVVCVAPTRRKNDVWISTSLFEPAPVDVFFRKASPNVAMFFELNRSYLPFRCRNYTLYKSVAGLVKRNKHKTFLFFFFFLYFLNIRRRNENKMITNRRDRFPLAFVRASEEKKKWKITISILKMWTTKVGSFFSFIL